MLRKLLGYAALMFGASTLTGLLTFGVSAFGMVTRSKEAFGDYTWYMRIYDVLMGVFIFGANASIQRFSAGNAEKRLAFSAMAYLLFGALMLVSAVAGAVVWFAVDFRYALSLFGLPWVVLYWWGRYLARSNLDAKREAHLLMVASLANSVGQFIFLTFTSYRDALIYGDFLALVASGLMALIYIARINDASPRAILAHRPSPALVKEAATFAAPLWVSGQVFAARMQAQRFWTRIGLGSAPLGALQGMDTMWGFATKPLEFIGQAALPGLVVAEGARADLYRDVLRLCLVAFTMIGIAVASGIPLVFEMIDAVAAFFGRPHAEAISVKYAELPDLLRLLALGMPLNAFETVTNQYAVSQGHPRSVLFANLATVAVVLAVLYPLTINYGLTGIVLGGLIGSAASALAYVIALRRACAPEMRVGLTWVLLATGSCAMAMVPVHAFRASPWSWLLSFPAVVLFGLCAFVTGLVRRDDFRRLFQAYRLRGQAASS